MALAASRSLSLSLSPLLSLSLSSHPPHLSPPAATGVLNDYEKAWYKTQYSSEAARSALAQRALTSFTDPFVGWAKINGSDYGVRQRSAWKASFDLSTLTKYPQYAEFVDMVAKSTATSHARSSPGKSPGSFKEIIAAVLGPSPARATWGLAVSLLAAEYHEQVQLDFDCFATYYNKNYLFTEPHEPMAWEHGEL